MKAKIKSYGKGVTEFYAKKVPKVDSNNTCLAVISLDFALKKDDNYYLQVFLKVCKFIKKNVTKRINNDFSDFSSDNGESEEE